LVARDGVEDPTVTMSTALHDLGRDVEEHSQRNLSEECFLGGIPSAMGNEPSDGWVSKQCVLRHPRNRETDLACLDSGGVFRRDCCPYRRLGKDKWCLRIQKFVDDCP
jgi:hypothetical protein